VEKKTKENLKFKSYKKLILIKKNFRFR